LRRVGIFGGTFDPIHYGHLVCAAELSEALGLDRVIFVPCNHSPHKPRYKPAAATDRVKMVELALRRSPDFLASDMEVKRGGLSYTVDTVRQVRRQVGPDVELWLLMGMDAYLDVPSWRYPEVILGECFLGVACRPGFRGRLLRGPAAKKTRFLDTTGIGISSTDLRKRVIAGRGIRFLVPPEVESYIRRKGLYGPARSERTGTGVGARRARTRAHARKRRVD
jgi:nicotinate-nucleotide adenylyltransferase